MIAPEWARHIHAGACYPTTWFGTAPPEGDLHEIPEVVIACNCSTTGEPCLFADEIAEAMNNDYELSENEYRWSPGD